MNWPAAVSKRTYITQSSVPDGAISRDVIFDTSAWLLIHGIESQIQNARVAAYSNLFKVVLEKRVKIYLLATIASEYIHRSLSMRSVALKHASMHEKVHQHSLYVEWMTTISDEVSYIRDDCTRLSDNFDVDDPEEMCRRCIGKSLGYNDIVISQACKRNNLILVTDDQDFSCEDIDVVTFNRKFTAPHLV